MKLIEWRWGLAPLTSRDAGSDTVNLAYALKFNAPDITVPALPKPSAPLIGTPCTQALLGGLLNAGGSAIASKWQQLADHAAQHGFQVRDASKPHPARP